MEEYELDEARKGFQDRLASATVILEHAESEVTLVDLINLVVVHGVSRLEAEYEREYRREGWKWISTPLVLPFDLEKKPLEIKVIRKMRRFTS